MKVIKENVWRGAPSQLVRLEKPMRFKVGGKRRSARFGILAVVRGAAWLYPASRRGKAHQVPAEFVGEVNS